MAIKIIYATTMLHNNNTNDVLYSVKVWWSECLANLLFSSIWGGKAWQMNRSANGLLIASTSFDDFSLANQR